MVTYVRETKAAKRLTAYVIMKGSRYVATVQVYFGDMTCTVNVFQTDKASYRSAATARLPMADDAAKRKAWDKTHFQRSTANGYGYDKETAALSSCIIDGHMLTNHCGWNRKLPKGMKAWPRTAKAPRGYQFANYSAELDGYTDCYRRSGLDYLREIGYNVIRAI